MNSQSAKRSYLITLGRESDIAYEELAHLSDFVDGVQCKKIGQRFAIVENSDLDAAILQDKLGGAIKIGHILSEMTKNGDIPASVEHLLPTLTKDLSGKVTFSIQFAGIGLNQKDAQDLSRAVKSYLSEQHISSRFVQGNQTGLTSVQLETQNIFKRGFELLIVSDGEKIFISRTLAYQNYKYWSKKDYDRPKSNPKRGMLPPKLARMMLNISCGYLRGTEIASDQSQVALLDPFCGEGTILMEGLELGLTVNGSDIDKSAVEDTKTNLIWLQKLGSNTGKIEKIVQTDVIAIDRQFNPNSVNIIVTEPYLGPPVRQELTKQQLDGIKNEYSRLLKNLFIHAKDVLKQNSVLTVVVPNYRQTDFSQLLVDKMLLDSCENFGYTPLERPLAYARPDAKIGRQIYFFRKKD